MSCFTLALASPGLVTTYIISASDSLKSSNASSTRLEWCLELEFFTFSLITDFSVMISKNYLAVQLEISHTKNYQKPLFKLFCRINFDTFYLFINDHNVQCNYWNSQAFSSRLCFTISLSLNANLFLKQLKIKLHLLFLISLVLSQSLTPTSTTANFKTTSRHHINHFMSKISFKNKIKQAGAELFQAHGWGGAVLVFGVPA